MWNNIKFQAQKTKLIDQIKQDPYLSQIIQELELNDQEIIYKYSDLIDIKLRQLNPQEYMDELKIIRTNKGTLQTLRFLVDNAKSRQYLFDNLILYKQLGIIKSDKIFSQIQSNSNTPSQIINYRQKLKNSKEQINKGFMLSGENIDRISKILSTIVNEWVFARKTVSYINISYLMDYFRNNFSVIDNTLLNIVDDLSKVDVLILDNLGYEQLPKWFLEKLIKILEFRVFNQKLTYIGSYFPLNFLSQHLFLENNNQKKPFINNLNKRFISLIIQLIEFELEI
ncbi:hypothetical protein [Mycoplasma sp. 3686d]|uniref:hypothetical protein n=1 Tax=Mycoplasma sp. 3686d TaxID=2967300 RepID=UPI00211CF32A|nr:hypothetical protein [Mycoplasma sp. 3686d]UUM24567.1 hypothetical protein NPA12_02595 [Mycoplasma sp. 3686d]